MREHAQRLAGLAEEEDHAGLGEEVRGDEDGDVGVGGRGSDGERDGAEASGLEAGVDYVGDGFWGGG